MSAPFFREAGSGPGVICLHANASSSGQWRALTELLAARFHVLAPDTYGAGKSPPWPQGRKVSLRDEVVLLEPVFARAGDGFSLVGHSYGGGIALVGALAHRQRLRSMVLYEANLFALVERESPGEVDGIRNTVAPRLRHCGAAIRCPRRGASSISGSARAPSIACPST
jgi:pimeloyl-ACP methyl ester carboxylesterase